MRKLTTTNSTGRMKTTSTTKIKVPLSVGFKKRKSLQMSKRKRRRYLGKKVISFKRKAKAKCQSEFKKV